ncbi:ABC transporter substrate-binding protein [Candidatus Poribacteria bacterium]|nr:ABC transporter substrate-binding protein [Candidatus Poribacteria bacterium]
MSTSKRLRIFGVAGQLAIIALVVLVAVMAISCSKKELPVVRLNIVTWPGYGPIYLAKEKGFFKEEGVEVDCQIQENTQARHAALVSGQIDLVGITLESVILANAEGIPMQVIGITDISDGGDGIVAKADISSIKDLKGKRVAFPEGQPSHLFLLYHLDKAGLTPSDIQPVFTDDAGKAGELFAAGQVDAAVTWEPWLSQVVDTGKGHILVNSKGAKDILIGIMAANRNYVTKNKDKLQRFLRGWYRGLEYVLAHKSEAVPIMAKAFQLPPEEFEAIMGGLRFIGKEEAKRLLGADGTRGEFYEISKYEEELWQKAGVTKKPVDPTLAYTGEIIAGAR